MENPPFWCYLPGILGIFYGYVSLPEGTSWECSTFEGVFFGWYYFSANGLACWFGARWFGILWGTPKNPNPFYKGIPEIQTTNKNQQWTISWRILFNNNGVWVYGRFFFCTSTSGAKHPWKWSKCYIHVVNNKTKQSQSPRIRNEKNMYIQYTRWALPVISRGP